MYSRRTMLMSSVSGVVGMLLASLGVRTNSVQANDELARNRKWLQENYTAPGKTTHYVPHQSVVEKEWTGHDGTVFRLTRVDNVISSHYEYVTTAYPRIPTSLSVYMDYTSYSYQLVANVGEDNFKDMLDAQCRDFEFAYYAGDLTR